MEIRLKCLLEADKTASAELKSANNHHDIRSLIEHMQIDAEATKRRTIGQPNLDKCHSMLIFDLEIAIVN